MNARTFTFFPALCNEDANGNVPLGKSCNRYWQCQGGYPRLQRCPAMLVFDRRSLRCVAPPTEDCDVPPVAQLGPGGIDNSDDDQVNKHHISSKLYFLDTLEMLPLDFFLCAYKFN